MKRRNCIALVFFMLVLLGGFFLWDRGSNSRPILAFKGYESSSTNGVRFARFELQNTTKRSIWLVFGGKLGSPLSPGFLERPVIAPLEAASNRGTKPYSVEVGSFIITDEELRPGANRVFDFPLVPAGPPEEVGISYYVGNFKDAHDFFEHMGIPLLDSRASLKDKLEYYLQKLKSQFRGPKYQEVWCQQPISSREEKPTNTTQPNSKTP
jgi:hypothetical protein